MTFRRHTDEEIQFAINVAAREMTAASPSRELRAAVMSRIAASQPRWGWRLALAGGAIGAVALSSAVLWNRQPVTMPTFTDTASATMPVATSTAIAEFATSTDVVVVPMPKPAPSFAVSASELEWHGRSVPALGEPDALHVAPLPSTELTVAPLDIAPLTVPPLASTANAGGLK